MKKRIIKTASGTVLPNSSPAAIEEFLIAEMKEALGDWFSSVTVKPFLKIDQDDGDLSGNVKNGFGAIQIIAYGTKLHIPFIIADKTLLPFDVIRLGDQEISYDYAKLRRLVNALEHKAKSQEEEQGDGDFKTMELANFDDMQYNNGFLGTIMNIRDHNKSTNFNGDRSWDGPGFGTLDEDRMMRTASTKIDVLESFHDIMEKVAHIKTYTPEQMKEFEASLLEKVAKEEEEGLEKTASVEDSLETAKVKREIISITEDKLFNVHRAASGNNISFPVFEGGKLEYRSGRVYRQFESWFKNTATYVSGTPSALVIDKTGGYAFLKEGSPFMASVKSPHSFTLKVDEGRALKTDRIYAAEKEPKTLFTPFVVKSSYLDEVNSHHSRMAVLDEKENTLFTEIYRCAEVQPFKKAGNEYELSNREFALIVSKDPAITQPTYMDREEIKKYILQKGRDSRDVILATNMVDHEKYCCLIPAKQEFFLLEKNIKHYYTKHDGLFTEGPLAKTASFNNQNKAKLIVKHDREPKKYSVEWQFTQDAGVADDMKATRLERRSAHDLSKDAAKAQLGRLGFDHRAQARFFEISDRNGRGATFDLPDLEMAAKASVEDRSKEKVQKKMKGMADFMLHSKNFMPIFENTIASGAAALLADAIPASVNAAQKVDDFFNWKQAMEVAKKMEKIATDINGAEWHEISALVNLKYQLDKVAASIHEGNFLANGHEVFEKVASLQPVIEKKASSLIDFNRKQLLHTDKYLIHPSIVKEALEQIDGLYQYASVKKNDFLKEAGTADLGRNINKMEDSVKNLQQLFTNANSKLRASIRGNDNLSKASGKVEEAETLLNDGVRMLQQSLEDKGNEAATKKIRNVAAAGAVGLPSIATLSYGYESAKNN